MTTLLIPALSEEHALFLTPGQSELPCVPDSPFHRLVGLSRTEMVASRGLEAAERRLLTEHFVSTFAWSAIRPLLPLPLVVPADVPPWSPRYCRSFYQWLPPEETLTAQDLQGLDDFDLLLRLFDFSAWRPILGQRFRSQFGPPPFDPVSIGLGVLLGLWKQWTWPTLLTELHSPDRGGGYCRRLGFMPDDLPCESTFRMAVGRTEKSWVLQCADSLALSLMAYGLIPTHSTFPSDPPERGVSIATDCQLVAARSHMRCRYQNANCFLSRALRQGTRDQRTCAAREDGKEAVRVTQRHVSHTVAWSPHATLMRPTSTMPAPISRPAPHRRDSPPIPLPLEGANIILATKTRPSTSSTIASPPFGLSLAPFPPPIATTICRPSPAFRTSFVAFRASTSPK